MPELRSAPKGGTSGQERLRTLQGQAQQLWGNSSKRVQSKLFSPLETQLKRKVCKGVMKLAKARTTTRLFKNAQG